MPKNYHDWLQFQRATLPPVLALGGEERAFIDDALVFVKEQVLSAGLADFNYDLLSGKTSTLDTIIGSANVLPVMAPRRLVLVRDAESIKEGDFTSFSSYLKAPCTSTALVFVFDQIDIRLKLPKLLDAEAVLFKLDHPKEEQMLPIIKKRAQRHQLACDDEAASLLLMEVGTDLLMLERALEKLALVCQAGRIDAADIMEQIAQTRLVDAFALGRAVAQANRNEAAKYLAKLKMAQEVPLRLVGMLAWQLRQVLKARALVDEGLSEQEIGKTLNIYGDRLKPVMSAARRWHLKVHASRLVRLYELDKELKRSRASAWLWLERVVFQLCPK